MTKLIVDVILMVAVVIHCGSELTQYRPTLPEAEELARKVHRKQDTSQTDRQTQNASPMFYTHLQLPM